MKKTALPLLCLLAISPELSLVADNSSVTNKTFLMPRSHGVNLALEKTAGWPNMQNRKDQEDAIGGNIQATFFMMGSTDEAALAKYFLFPSTVVTQNTSSVSTAACDEPCKTSCGDCKSVQFERKATASIN